jgi:hypothetical protein
MGFDFLGLGGGCAGWAGDRGEGWLGWTGGGGALCVGGLVDRGRGRKKNPNEEVKRKARPAQG